ncbi:MAG: F0F1 ATP synthase subunit A [Actinobacteria bacterium]|nr:F0F1 ATP synthase subunit A [Actinomycetota bacterium]
MELSISLSPQVLFNIGWFPVTNSFIWTLVLSFFLITVTVLIGRRLKIVPGGLQNFMELVLEGAYSFVKSVIGTDEKAKKVFPLVFTMFLLILLANLATFIPGQAAFSIARESGPASLFRAVMADYGLVFVMTMITVILTQIVAIAVSGPLGYIGKFINLSGIKEFFREAIKGKFKFGVLAQGFLDFFLGLMDIVGEIAKIISLSFRLFGNIFAGEVLGAVMLFLVPFIAPLPFLFLGLLTAVVQAFVFAVLTLIFITMASEVEKKEENAA